MILVMAGPGRPGPARTVNRDELALIKTHIEDDIKTALLEQKQAYGFGHLEPYLRVILRAVADGELEVAHLFQDRAMLFDQQEVFRTAS